MQQEQSQQPQQPQQPSQRFSQQGQGHYPQQAPGQYPKQPPQPYQQQPQQPPAQPPLYPPAQTQGMYAQPAFQQTQVPQVPYPYVPLQHEYQTLGGFLLVLLIFLIIGTFSSVLTFLGDLQADLSTIREYLSVRAFASALLWGVTMATGLAQSAIDVVLIVMIFTKNRHLVTVNALSLIAALIGIAGICGSVFLDPATSSTGAAVILGVAIVGTVISVAITTLLCVYFLKSVRVRTYLGNDAYITKTLWKFVKPPLPAVPDSPAQAGC